MACVTAARDLAHRRVGARTLCGALPSPTAVDDEDAAEPALVSEAKAAARLPLCAECRALDVV